MLNYIGTKHKEGALVFFWTMLPGLVAFLLGVGAWLYGALAFSSADGLGVVISMLGIGIVMLSGILAVIGVAVFGVLQLARIFG